MNTGSTSTVLNEEKRVALQETKDFCQRIMDACDMLLDSECGVPTASAKYNIDTSWFRRVIVAGRRDYHPERASEKTLDDWAYSSQEKLLKDIFGVDTEVKDNFDEVVAYWGRYLSDKEKEVIELELSGSTNSEIVQELCLSKQRIYQLRNSAIKKMRHHSGAYELGVEEYKKTL